MADYTRVLLKGVIARLKAYTDLTDIVGTKIYSDVPQQTAKPYCVVEISSIPSPTKDNSVHKHDILVHGFSATKSPNQAMQIAEEVFNALDRQESNITLDSGSMTYLQTTELKDTFKEPDGNIWHSIINFNCLIY